MDILSKHFQSVNAGATASKTACGEDGKTHIAAAMEIYAMDDGK
jgi:hypothetical protein